MALMVNTMRELDREDRQRLVHHAARFMLPVVGMPLVGAWFLGAFPADSRAWVTGGSVAMTLFLNVTIGASALIGGYVVLGLWKQRLGRPRTADRRMAAAAPAVHSARRP